MVKKILDAFGSAKLVEISCTKQGFNYTRLGYFLASKFKHEKTVYIASHPKIDDEITKVKLIMKSANVKVLTGQDVRDFLATRYSHCDQIKRFQGDILSVIEKFILVSCERFFGTAGSTWSMSVIEERQFYHRKVDWQISQ